MTTSTKRLLSAVLIPFVFLGLVELALRLLNFGYPTTFLVPYEISGHRGYVDNQFFGYRFFPQRMTRTPAPIVLDRSKPAGVVRVAILGESAAMGEPLPEYGLARMLEVMLPERFTGGRFEVLNAAMTAINSHVIVEIARDLVRFHPDVFVVYMGNNEVVGPYGPGTIFEPFARWGILTRIRVLATRLRLAQLLQQLSTEWSDPMAGQEAWTGMEMFTRRQVPADDPRLAHVYDQFKGNLEFIIQIAQKAKVAVVLSTVAVNLRDCPPFSGATDVAIDLARQRDQDRLRFRADSAINRIIREVANHHPEGVRLVDAEAAFSAASPEGTPGKNFFVDHVHFNLPGNHLLASQILDALSGIPPLRGQPQGATLSSEACAQKVLWTDWNDLDLTEIMITRRERMPFQTQPGNLEQLIDLHHHRTELATRLKHADLADVAEKYGRAMSTHPEDWRYPAGWADILLHTDRFAEAIEPLRRVCDRLPHRIDLRGRLALAFGYLEQEDEALEVLRGTGLKTGQFVTEALLNAARTLASDGRLPISLRFDQEACRLDPRSVDAQLELGARYAASGQIMEAEDTFRAALRYHPHHPGVLAELAILLTLQDRWNEAQPLFERLLLSDSTGTEGRLKHAVALIYRKQVQAAEHELTMLVREHPDFAPAHYQLGKLSALRQDWPGATSHLEDAVRCNPTDARAHEELARVYRQQGREQDAQRQVGLAQALSAAEIR